MSNAIRVLLVDDHTLFRESLRRVLEADRRFQVTGEAGSLKDALALLHAQSPFDLALVDLQLSATRPADNGLAAVRAMRAVQPATAIVLLTAGAGQEELHEAANALAASVFLKSESAGDLFRAIEETLAGRVYVSDGTRLLLQHAAAAAAAQPTLEAAFTARELLVLRHITEGLSNKEIADQLALSESGVKALLQRLFEKTSVRTRSQLVRYVFESGLTLP